MFSRYTRLVPILTYVLLLSRTQLLYRYVIVITVS